MKKRVLNILLVLIIIMGITACGNDKLSDITKKINNCETVKTYKEYGYDIKASSSKDALTISSTMDDTKNTVEFKLDGNVLSNENLSVDDLLAAILLINGVGQTYGYKDGELSQNVNTFPDEIKEYTLDKEGLELITEGDKISLKIDITKKVPLIDMDKFYLKTSDFDMIEEIIKDNTGGNQSGNTGNIAYDVFVSEEQSTIEIGQDEKLSDSAYKSILSALEVMYGKDSANQFQKLYPKFIDGKTEVEAFTIEVNYKDENEDESMFKDKKIVLVTIDNNLIKSNNNED